MKRYIAAVALLSIAALIAITSCKPAADKLQTEVIHKSETLRAGDSTFELDYRFEYLTGSVDDRVTGEIQASQIAEFFGSQFVRVDPSASAAAFDETVFSDFERAIIDYPWDGYLKLRSWSEVVGESVLAYTIEHSEYTGGAHGMDMTVYSNYDLHTGARLTLDDLFTPEGKAALPAVIRSAIMNDNGVTTWEALNDRFCYSAEDDIFATENFLLSSTQLTFMYNPYDIGCYAQGPTIVRLALDDLAGFRWEILQ